MDCMETHIIKPASEDQHCGFRRNKQSCTSSQALKRTREEFYNAIRVAKTKALINFAVTAKLICAFGFAYAKRLFSHTMP